MITFLIILASIIIFLFLLFLGFGMYYSNIKKKAVKSVRENLPKVKDSTLKVVHNKKFKYMGNAYRDFKKKGR